jgi:rifampicin phosphotransferase
LMTPDQLAALPDQRPDELVYRYRRIEGDLLTHWDAPLINDFFAMIFYGVLKKLVTTWGGDTSGALQNALISLTGDIVSAEPAQRMAEMAVILADHPTAPMAIDRFCQGSLAEIQRLMATIPPLEAAYQSYLAKFGDRCLEELKLESPTLADDPLPLLRTIGYLAQRGATVSPATSDPTIDSTTIDPTADPTPEATLHQTLRGHPLRGWLLGWVLHNTRRLVRNRENLRFERTRVFGQARRVFVEMGKRLYALGMLKAAEDVFFLEVEEIMGLVEGTNTTVDLQGLVAVRQAENRQLRSQPALPRRLETFGLPCLTQAMEFQPSSPVLTTADSWQGMGCAPGRVQGRVSLVSNPRLWLQRQGRQGEPQILVAASTDPGWVLLFPHAQGLLVERGSVLSHVAIVARELGLPMISDLPEITTTLAEGDWVAMDGRTGHIQRLAPPPPTGVPHAQ